MRKTLLSLVLTAYLLCAFPAPAEAQVPVPRFEAAECPIDVPDEPPIDCGYLVVPEDHADPAGETIRLPVITIYSRSAKPSPDPILFTEGGPGFSSLESVWWLARSVFVEERDVIILEQRGNLYAQPSLDCDVSMWRQATEGSTPCLDSLHERGIDITHYTTQQNAADIDALRRALNIETWNLFGSSYSTRLFLHVMQHYPQGARSAALDSVNPPNENRYLHDPEHSIRALEKLFADCAADQACAAAYPDLKSSFYALYHRLNADPTIFTIVYDPQGQRLEEPFREEVSGYRLLEWMVVGAFYGPAYGGGKTSYLPLLIDQVEVGTTALLYPWLVDELFSGFGASSGFAWGLYFAINCQNDFPAITPDQLQAQAAAYPELEGYIRHAREIEICGLWNLPAAHLDAHPVVSDIPTLVLAGGYDPITPPEWGRGAAEHLTYATYFEFPAAGHGVAGESECARNIQAAFLADPDREPDGSCVANAPGPEFVLPGDVIVVPGFYHSLADINLGVPQGKPWLEATVIVALLLFAFEIVFLLATAIVRIVRKREQAPESELLARIAHPLAGLVAALGISVPVLMTEVNHVLNNNPIMRYFGLPAAYAPAYYLGVIAFVFAVLSGVLVILMPVTWIRHTWPLLKRGLFSLVTLMAVVFAILLVRWGLVTALF